MGTTNQSLSELLTLLTIVLTDMSCRKLRQYLELLEFEESLGRS